jgi:drug/metabolite transporter (DMT)-like permease
MVSILGGSLAALAWGFSTLAASRAAAAVGSRVVLAWVMLVGIALAVPITFAQPVPALDAPAIGLLAISGLGNVLGLLLAYTAISTGKVSLVAPIVSTQGAGAALIAIVLGESVGLPVILALAVAAAGVVLVSVERSGAEPRTSAAQDRRAALIAVLAAALFAIGLYATGRIGDELGIGLTVLPSRLIGFVFVTLPLLTRGRMSVTRSVLPVVLLMGVLEVVGVVGIAIGSTDVISITVVISSQFAAVAAVGAVILFGERIQRHQVMGIVLILAGVAAVALLRAGN